MPALDRQSGVPIQIHGVVPSIGEDTTNILAEMLGFAAPDIHKLYDELIVHRTEPCTEPQLGALNP